MNKEENNFLYYEQDVDILKQENKKVNKLLEKEYLNQLQYINTVGLKAEGIYSHLQSYEAFCVWYNKMNEIVGDEDYSKRKALIW